MTIKNNKAILAIITSLALVLISTQKLDAYPIDGYDYSGIKRLEYYRLANLGEVKGTQLPNGSLMNLEDVKPRLLNSDSASELPENDPELARKLKKAIPGGAGRYSITLLDLSDPDNIAYAEHNPNYVNNVGSVGKFLVAMALFAKLAELYPDDIAARIDILKNTVVTADRFSQTDSHTVRYWDVEARKLKRHPIRIGDQASLWEYLDWMISPSSNSAAAMVQRELMLLSHYKHDYPVDEATQKDFFKSTPKKELSAIFLDTMLQPLKSHGVDTEKLRQGSFFTRGGKNVVSGTNSRGNTRELIKLLYLMEKGELVDEFSSTEIKRLMYNTERRIRYASHPALHDSAMYFKSGSLYKCVAEEGFSCGKYKGNKLNLLASLAIVESPSTDHKLHYLVVVHSNVLKVNSAVAHQTLGLRIQRILEKRHGVSASE